MKRILVSLEKEGWKDMKGILTDCVTEKESEIELEYEIVKKDGKRILYLLNGVTGYESFYIDKVSLPKGLLEFETDLKAMTERGWLACMGTKNKWDKLFISGEEMKKVFEREELI